MEKRKVRRWSETECRKLKELYLHGDKLKDIALSLDRTYSNIIWKISDLGLRRNGKVQRLSSTGGNIIHVAEGHIIHRSR